MTEVVAIYDDHRVAMDVMLQLNKRCSSDVFWCRSRNGRWEVGRCSRQMLDGRFGTVDHPVAGGVAGSRKAKVEKAVERLHPQSWRELRQLVRLHGARALVRAIAKLEREEQRLVSARKAPVTGFKPLGKAAGKVVELLGGKGGGSKENA